MFLIAEVGNNHAGSYNKAVELIRVAKESGADAVKLQAINGDVQTGSMPQGFYKQCEFTYFYYCRLIEYGKEIGIPVFYSIFDNSLWDLYFKQKYDKCSASQTDNGMMISDNKNSFVSINSDCYHLPEYYYANIMYASDYLVGNPNLLSIHWLSLHYARHVGYSDHTIGVKRCIQAAMTWNAPVIEKHFTIDTEIKYEGKLFRDCIHSATPKQFEELAKAVK